MLNYVSMGVLLYSALELDSHPVHNKGSDLRPIPFIDPKLTT